MAKVLLKGKAMKTRLTTMMVAAGFALASLGAQAASEWTWVLNSAPVGSDLPGTATVMGYSASSNTAQLVATSGAGLPDMTWYSGGYGICSPVPGDSSCLSPYHAMDNNIAKESLVLSFGKAVTLNALNIGWMSTDSDVSVLAYTGAGAPVYDSTVNYSNLVTTKGWTLVSQLANVASSTSVNAPSVTFSTAVSSSYWMIAAYNSTFGGTALSDGNDYVKVYAVAGNTTNPPGKVSEPAALMLVGAAMLGVVGLRRRRQAGQ
jgi:hypothetical protein